MTDNKRFLCKQCKDAYRSAGYEVKPIFNDVKEPCDICSKLGFEFVVERGKEHDSSNN